MAGIEVTVELTGDRGMLERGSKALRNLRPYLEKVAVYGMAAAQQRLLERLSPHEDAVTSGHLVNSLTIGGPESIYELEDNQAVYGSNLPYAAQVNYGGTIWPDTAKALAIPLTPRLKRDRLWPRDIDPGREILRFVPYTGARPNIFGLLVDDPQPLTGRQRKARGSTIYGPGPLFALAHWVHQEGKHFMELTEADIKEITGPLWKEHVAAT